MLIVLVALLLILFLIWIVGVFYANDFSLPSKNVSEFKNVLVIFPHADDEVLNAGGLIHTLSENKSNVTLVILTKGEKGNADAHYDEKLKEIRTNEAQEASKVLGVTKLIQEDFGDGELIHKKSHIETYMRKTITAVRPDLIVTYDLAGLYGHPDHIVASEVITKLHQENHIPLWYVSLPKKVLNLIQLPEHMANDPRFKNRRVFPVFKVFVGNSIFVKIKAVAAYKSQKESFSGFLPVKQIPGTFFYSMQLYEYFFEVL